MTHFKSLQIWKGLPVDEWIPELGIRAAPCVVETTIAFWIVFANIYAQVLYTWECLRPKATDWGGFAPASDEGQMDVNTWEFPIMMSATWVITRHGSLPNDSLEQSSNHDCRGRLSSVSNCVSKGINDNIHLPDEIAARSASSHRLCHIQPIGVHDAALEKHQGPKRR